MERSSEIASFPQLLDGNLNSPPVWCFLLSVISSSGSSSNSQKKVCRAFLAYRSFWLNQCNRYHNLSVRNLSSPNLGSQFGHSIQPNGTFIDPSPTQLLLGNLSSETFTISIREKGNSFLSFCKGQLQTWQRCLHSSCVGKLG